MNLIETQRLQLRHLTKEDGVFILELLNEPAFIQNIGDKGVRSLADAQGYIEGQGASYEKYGFGMYRVALKETDEPIGMCGLVKREGLEDVDIGYALLQRFWSKGYAYEAASAVLDYAKSVLRLPRIVGITAPDNHGSARVLEKIGLRYEKMVHIPGHTEPSRLFVPPTDQA
ncbi:MAG: GNAT family N-acetyltransferase [Ardenticatenales bacterium]|nr:GNAT family N-acetyltransferase [Ardenticatenales bacterium]